MWEECSVIDEYLSFIRDVDRLSDKTVYDRKVWLNDFDKFLRTKGVQKIEEIQLKHIREYLASKSNLKRNSLAALITVLRSFFRCLESDFEITLGFKWQKIKTITPEKVDKTVVPEDIVCRVLGEVDEQMKIIIYLMFGSGLRVSELVRIRTQDIYDNYISVRGKGKAGGKCREVLVHPEIMKLVREFIIKNSIDGYLIKRKQIHKNVDQSKPVDTDTIARWLKVFEKYGYHVSPHIARYSFATNMYLNGADIKTVQISLGHENVNTTQNYLHVPPKYIREQFDKFMTLRPI